MPLSFQPLTGCANPNTGNLEWGLGCRLLSVYTTVDNTTPVVGAPIYNSNAIFWTSRENAPGQSILLAGAFTDGAKTAQIAYVSPGTIDWQTAVNASMTVLPTTQQGLPCLPQGTRWCFTFKLNDPFCALGIRPRQRTLYKLGNWGSVYY